MSDLYYIKCSIEIQFCKISLKIMAEFVFTIKVKQMTKTCHFTFANNSTFLPKEKTVQILVSNLNYENVPIHH